MRYRTPYDSSAAVPHAHGPSTAALLSHGARLGLFSSTGSICACSVGRVMTGQLRTGYSTGFRAFYAASVISIAGSTMAGLATTFAVLEVSSSPTALGAVLAARTMPMLAIVLFGGALADRFSPVRMLRLSNLCSFFTQAGVASIVITHHADLVSLAALEAANGILAGAAMPAIGAMIPSLVGSQDIQRANALLSMTRAVLRIIGPAAAAALIVGVGPGWALAADAVSFAAAFFVLLPVAATGSTTNGGRLADTLSEGWRAFTGTPWIWRFVGAFTVLNFVHAGAIFTLGPLVASDSFGVGGWGYALSSEAAGLLMAGMLLRRARVRQPLRLAFLTSAAVALPIAALGTRQPLTMVCIAFFLGGLGIEAGILCWNFAIQHNVPTQLLSRIYSYDIAASYAAVPAGQLTYGPLGAEYGLSNVLVVSAVMYGSICVGLASTSWSQAGNPTTR